MRINGSILLLDGSSMLSFLSGRGPPVIIQVIRQFYDRNRLILGDTHFEENPNQYINFETLDV